MALAGLSKASVFDWSAVAERIMAVYERVIGKPVVARSRKTARRIGSAGRVIELLAAVAGRQRDGGILSQLPDLRTGHRRGSPLRSTSLPLL